MIKQYESVPLLSKEEVENRKETLGNTQETLGNKEETLGNQDLAAPTTPKTIFVWDEQLGKFATQDNPHTPAAFDMFDGHNYNSRHNIKLTKFATVNRDPRTGLPIKGV